MDYLVTFEDGSTGYLAHHGVLGMKWGVRNAETQARYSRGAARLGKKDAKRAAKLQYDYGARSRTQKTAHQKIVQQRGKKLGESYTSAYSKTYANQNHQKLALKAEKRLTKDRKLAAKSDSAGKVASKVGGILGGAVGGMAVGLAAQKYTGNLQLGLIGGSVGSAIGAELGRAPGKAVVSRHQKSRRKLNYSY